MSGDDCKICWEQDYDQGCFAKGSARAGCRYLVRLEADLEEAYSVCREVLAKLEKGAPGWGVSKDMLRALLHKRRTDIVGSTK